MPQRKQRRCFPWNSGWVWALDEDHDCSYFPFWLLPYRESSFSFLTQPDTAWKWEIFTQIFNLLIRPHFGKNGILVHYGIWIFHRSHIFQRYEFLTYDRIVTSPVIEIFPGLRNHSQKQLTRQMHTMSTCKHPSFTSKKYMKNGLLVQYITGKIDNKSFFNWFSIYKGRIYIMHHPALSNLKSTKQNNSL